MSVVFFCTESWDKKRKQSNEWVVLPKFSSVSVRVLGNFPLSTIQLFSVLCLTALSLYNTPLHTHCYTLPTTWYLLVPLIRSKMSDSETQGGNRPFFFLLFAYHHPLLFLQDPVPSTEKSEESSSQESERQTVFSILQANPAYSEGSRPPSPLRIKTDSDLFFFFVVSKFVHWRDPIRTGLFFGIFNCFYLLLTWRDYTVVSLLSYMGLALLLVCFAYSNFVVLKAKWIQGKQAENPFS